MSEDAKKRVINSAAAAAAAADGGDDDGGLTDDEADDIELDRTASAAGANGGGAEDATTDAADAAAATAAAEAELIARHQQQMEAKMERRAAVEAAKKAAAAAGAAGTAGTASASAKSDPPAAADASADGDADTNAGEDDATDGGDGRKKRRAKQEVDPTAHYSSYCNICESDGELFVCEGRCLRSFHAACLAACLPADADQPDASDANQKWLCPDCAASRQECFICKKKGPEDTNLDTPIPAAEDYATAAVSSAVAMSDAPSASVLASSSSSAAATTSTSPVDEKTAAAAAAKVAASAISLTDGVLPNGPGVKKCKQSKCGKFYHLSCLRTWAVPVKFTGAKGAAKSFLCPHHTCNSCRDAKRKRSDPLLRCYRCPQAYHAPDCIRPGSRNLLGNYVLCPFHTPLATTQVDTLGGQLPDGVWAVGKTSLYDRLNMAIPEEPILIFRADTLLGGAKGVMWHPVPGEHDFKLPLSVKTEGDAWQPEELAPKPYKKIKRNDYRSYPGGKALKVADSDDKCECADRMKKSGKAAAAAAATTGADSKSSESGASAADMAGRCGDDCMNRVTFAECNARICGFGADGCSNRRLVKHEYAPVKIKRTTGRGWGLYLKKDVKADDLIVEYCGEVLTNQQLEERLADDAVKGETNFYMFAINKRTVLDAKPMGNNARFINHSCDPNCISQIWTVAGVQRVGIFAKAAIAADTELTYDYNFEAYWPEGKEQKCLCGAENCSGLLGARPKKKEKNAAASPNGKKKKRKSKSKTAAAEVEAGADAGGGDATEATTKGKSKSKSKSESESPKAKRSQSPKTLKSKPKSKSKSKSASKSGTNSDSDSDTPLVSKSLAAANGSTPKSKSQTKNPTSKPRKSKSKSADDTETDSDESAATAATATAADSTNDLAAAAGSETESDIEKSKRSAPKSDSMSDADPPAAAAASGGKRRSSKSVKSETAADSATARANKRKSESESEISAPATDNATTTATAETNEDGDSSNRSRRKKRVKSEPAPTVSAAATTATTAAAAP